MSCELGHRLRLPGPCLVSFLLLAAASAGAQSPAPVLRFEAATEAGRGSLVVEGLALDQRALGRVRRLAIREWESILSLRTSSSPAGSQPILGHYEAIEAGLRFTPRFPLAAGLEFTADFSGADFDSFLGVESRSTPDSKLVFSTRDPGAQPTARVTAVYPSAEEIPENTLRLYVEFDSAMRARDVLPHIRVLDAAGEALAEPFVEVSDGLWDSAQTRLTLFFHPGRLKRGVGPNSVAGLPLRSGESYRLVVAQSLVDARGVRLAESFETWLRVGPADRQSPDPGTWRLEPPSRDRDELTLRFPESLDHGLLQRMLAVRDPQGRSVPGEIRIGEAERTWTFVPERPWLAGEHAVVVDPRLEDLAGNSIAAPFEVREQALRERLETSLPAIELKFVVAPPLSAPPGS